MKCFVVEILIFEDFEDGEFCVFETWEDDTFLQCSVPSCTQAGNKKKK